LTVLRVIIAWQEVLLLPFVLKAVIVLREPQFHHFVLIMGITALLVVISRNHVQRDITVLIILHHVFPLEDIIVLLIRVNPIFVLQATIVLLDQIPQFNVPILLIVLLEALRILMALVL